MHVVTWGSTFRRNLRKLPSVIDCILVGRGVPLKTSGLVSRGHFSGKGTVTTGSQDAGGERR